MALRVKGASSPSFCNHLDPLVIPPFVSQFVVPTHSQTPLTQRDGRLGTIAPPGQACAELIFVISDNRVLRGHRF